MLLMDMAVPLMDMVDMAVLMVAMEDMAVAMVAMVDTALMDMERGQLMPSLRLRPSPGDLMDMEDMDPDMDPDMVLTDTLPTLLTDTLPPTEAMDILLTAATDTTRGLLMLNPRLRLPLLLRLMPRLSPGDLMDTPPPLTTPLLMATPRTLPLTLPTDIHLTDTLPTAATPLTLLMVDTDLPMDTTRGLLMLSPAMDTAAMVAPMEVMVDTGLTVMAVKQNSKMSKNMKNTKTQEKN